MTKAPANDGKPEGGVSDMHQYMNAIHSGFEAKFGVGLLQIGADLFGEGRVMEQVQSAMEQGVSVDDFVDQVGSGFALVPGDKAQTIYRAALVGYSEACEGWEIDGLGGIFAQHDAGILRMTAEPSGSKGFAAEFAISIAEGAEIEIESGRQVVPEGTEFTEVARGIDIDVALRSFRENFVPGTGMRLS